MKQYVNFSWLPALALLITLNTVQAQPDKKPKAKKEDGSGQIIIKSKDGKDTKLTIEIKDGEVTVNGKPLAEFKDDHVTIRKGDNLLFDMRGEPFAMTIPRSRFRDGDFYFNDNLSRLRELEGITGAGEDNAFLGVITEKHEDGARITEVMEKTAAEKAALKEGDIITRINDKIIDDPNDLSKVMSTYKPEEKVTVTYKRNGKEEKAIITLGKRKGIRAYGFSQNFDSHPGFNFSFSDWAHPPKLGIRAQETDEGKGLKILEIDEDSPAAKAGMKEGDIITSVDGTEVNDIDVLRDKAMEGIRKGSFVMKYTRDGKAAEATVKIPKKLKTTNL
jgi:serine protease Do